MFSFVIEEGVGVGWTLYPTLICVDFHSSGAVDFLLMSIHLLGISSILNSLNICCTLFSLRLRFYSMVFVCLFV
jgi:cytochrome c oxidase subunit 1